MNREIKFRGFSEKLQQFIYGFFHEVEAEGIGYSYIFNQGHTLPVRADSVSQFTGLYDKNNKEIYEGDIVKDNELTGKVVFACPSFIVETKNDIYALAKGLVMQTQLLETEVIGNIFKNSELLQ
ncbi:MAG: YopX family protein [Flavobacterium sp.]